MTKLAYMPNRRSRLSLGGRIKARRLQLGLSVAEAARRAGVDRKTWSAWEKDASIPDDRNHRLIDEFCEWGAGSAQAVLDGRPPRLRRPALATVTPLHPGQVPPDDEFVAELRDMGLSAQVLDSLIAAYWAEKAGADVQRQERYRNFAREAGG